MAEKEKKPSRLVNWLAEHPMRACVIVLSVIAMAAGLLLGGINELTYQSPEEKLAKNLNKAYATEGTWENVSLEGITVNSKDKSVSVTGAYKNENGADVVYIYTTTAKGYIKVPKSLTDWLTKGKIVDLYSNAQESFMQNGVDMILCTDHFFHVTI